MERKRESGRRCLCLRRQLSSQSYCLKSYWLADEPPAPMWFLLGVCNPCTGLTASRLLFSYAISAIDQRILRFLWVCLWFRTLQTPSSKLGVLTGEGKDVQQRQVSRYASLRSVSVSQSGREGGTNPRWPRKPPTAAAVPGHICRIAAAKAPNVEPEALRLMGGTRVTMVTPYKDAHSSVQDAQKIEE